MDNHLLPGLLALGAWQLALAICPVPASAGMVGDRPSLADLPPLQIAESSVPVGSVNRGFTMDRPFGHVPHFRTPAMAGRSADAFPIRMEPESPGAGQRLEMTSGPFEELRRSLITPLDRSDRISLSIDALPDADPGVVPAPKRRQGDAASFTSAMPHLPGPNQDVLFGTHVNNSVDGVRGLAVPIPPAVLSGLAMLGGMGGVIGARKLFRNAHCSR